MRTPSACAQSAHGTQLLRALRNLLRLIKRAIQADGAGPDTHIPHAQRKRCFQNGAEIHARIQKKVGAQGQGRNAGILAERAHAAGRRQIPRRHVYITAPFDALNAGPGRQRAEFPPASCDER